MAEKIEFIPANELPEADGDEVSVLCLENGEMKQKSGASLGGGKADLVIQLTDGEPSISSGSYDAVVAKLQSGEMANVDIVGTRNSSYVACKAVSVALPVDGGELFILAYCGSSSISFLYVGNDYAYFD